MTPVETYCLGLVTEEAGEAQQLVGKAMRFGLDTPGPDGRTAREMLVDELGDLLAALCFAERHGVVDHDQVDARCQRKLAKLLDPTQRDNLGRQLAPTPGARS